MFGYFSVISRRKLIDESLILGRENSGRRAKRAMLTVGIGCHLGLRRGNLSPNFTGN